VTLATLKLRETKWIAHVRRRRRRERAQRAVTMDLQRRFHADDPGVTHAQVEEAKRQLTEIRVELADAEAALARVREQIAALSAPKMITSEQLGLSYQNVFGPKGAVVRGAGHYTAGGRARNASQLAEEMRKDHDFHLGKGWGGLAYEAMIADDGTIGLGNPMERKSAAVDSTNTGMVSICCPGTRGDRMTDEQERSVRWLLDNWHTGKVPKRHRLPRPAREFGWKGHHEYPAQSTECPGVMLSDYRELWR
jgi:N-acetylmuramoyl-L-alanine amidase